MRIHYGCLAGLTNISHSCEKKYQDYYFYLLFYIPYGSTNHTNNCMEHRIITWRPAVLTVMISFRSLIIMSCFHVMAYEMSYMTVESLYRLYTKSFSFLEPEKNPNLIWRGKNRGLKRPGAYSRSSASNQSAKKA